MYISVTICSIVIISDFFVQGIVFIHAVYDTLFSHKASFGQESYLHPLFPSLDINLLLNAIEKCRGMYIHIYVYRLTLKYNEYIWGKIILEPKLIHIFFNDCPHWYVLDISYFASWGIFLLFILVQHVNTRVLTLAPILVLWTSYDLQLWGPRKSHLQKIYQFKTINPLLPGVYADVILNQWFFNTYQT